MTAEPKIGDRVALPGKCVFERVVQLRGSYVVLSLPCGDGKRQSAFICADMLVFNPRDSLWEPIHDDVLVHLDLPSRTERTT